MPPLSHKLNKAMTVNYKTKPNLNRIMTVPLPIGSQASQSYTVVFAGCAAPELGWAMHHRNKKGLWPQAVHRLNRNRWQPQDVQQRNGWQLQAVGHTNGWRLQAMERRNNNQWWPQAMCCRNRYGWQPWDVRRLNGDGWWPQDMCQWNLVLQGPFLVRIFCHELRREWTKKGRQEKQGVLEQNTLTETLTGAHSKNSIHDTKS